MNIAIAAVDKNFGIGYNNKLLISIPNDLEYFKLVTKGKTVIMGSNTWASLPTKPLPNRYNMIITRNPPYEEESDNYKFVTWEDAKEYLAKERDENVFIIGGGVVYEELLPLCDKIYLTYIDKEFENVDTYFPALSNSEWTLAMTGEWEEHEGIKYQFRHYERI